jgi:hypothetical protein
MTTITDAEKRNLTDALGHPEAAAQVAAKISAGHGTISSAAYHAVKNMLSPDDAARFLKALTSGSTTLPDKTKAALKEALGDVVLGGTLTTKLSGIT